MRFDYFHFARTIFKVHLDTFEAMSTGMSAIKKNNKPIEMDAKGFRLMILLISFDNSVIGHQWDHFHASQHYLFHSTLVTNASQNTISVECSGRSFFFLLQFLVLIPQIAITNEFINRI